MNNEQFLDMFGDIDEEFIEQANYDVNVWIKEKNGVVVRADETRRLPLRTIIASAACAAAVLFGVFIMKNFIPASSDIGPVNSGEDPNGSYSVIAPEDVKYYHIDEEFQYHHSAEELVTSAKMVLIGKVTDIEFQPIRSIIHSCYPDHNPTETERGYVYTVLTVEVMTPYKGVESEFIKVEISCGLKDVYIEEQLKALGEYASDGIGIYEGMPEIKIGEEYLFSLRASEGSTDTYIMNPEQSILSIRKPYLTDIFGYTSVKDIISYFGEDKWNEFASEHGITENKPEHTPKHPTSAVINGVEYPIDSTTELELGMVTLTDEDLFEIGRLINLTKLDLSRDNISDLSPFKNLVNLEELNLQDNHVTDISPLSGMTKLTYLMLYGNEVSDLSPLKGLIHLQHLNVVKNKVTDLSPLSEMNELEILSFGGNNVKSLEPLRGLKKLSDLSFGFSKISDISPLVTLPSLRYLGISGSPITDWSPLVEMKNLKRLSVSQIKIDDLTVFSKLTNLEYLYLDKCELTDITPLANLTNLTELSLSGNKITDISPLVNLTKLDYLSLADNRIADLTPLMSMKNLTFLYLEWGGSGPDGRGPSYEEVLPLMEALPNCEIR